MSPKAKKIISNLGWGVMVVGFAFFMVFALWMNAQQVDKDQQNREDYVRKETTCELSGGRMIDDICYKSDKLEVIEVG